MDLETFNTLKFLPFPMFDGTKEHYRSFDESYITETTEADRPSLNLKLTTTKEDAKFKSVCVATKVRGTITCTDCQKSRCVYSAKLLTIAQSNAIQCIREAEMYSCGASLFGEAHPLCEVVVVRTTLMCELPVEATYYGATTTNLPDVCNHCGGASGAQFVNDDSLNNLKNSTLGYVRIA